MGSKMLSGALVATMAFASTIIPVNAYGASDWNNSTGYGSITKVDSNITIMKGEETLVGGMYYGPYTKASTQKLADGILEEIHIDLSKDNFDHAEYFDLSVALNDTDDKYVTEAAIRTQRDGDTIVVTTGIAPDFKAEITEDGVYTYQYKMFVEEGKSYVCFSVLLWDEVVSTTGDIDFDTIVTSDTQHPVADHAEDVRYVWFASISAAKGVKVYTELPEKPAEDDDYEAPDTACYE